MSVYRVTARDFNGRILEVARGIPSRDDAERLAERLFARDKVNTVDVEREGLDGIESKGRRIHG